MALAALLGLVVGTHGAYAQGPPSGKGPAAQGAHVDKHLEDRLSKGKDTDLLRVIVRMKPGTKGGIVNALRAEGVQSKHDFSLIEGFAVEVPVARLRALQKHQDILALSVDGAVTSFAVTPPVGTTYTVTNTSNSGAGSLRQAITDANAHAGADTIWFNISGTGVHTIKPATALPSITGPVILDATTDDSFAANGNKPAIELNGTSAGANVVGLNLVANMLEQRLAGLAVEAEDEDFLAVEPELHRAVDGGPDLGMFQPLIA